MTHSRPLLALLSVLLGCSPTLEPIHWEGLDIDALREAIASPTGVVDEASANEISSEVVTNVDAYEAVSGYLHTVFLDDSMPDMAPAWVIPRALNGTSVYLLVACPGQFQTDTPAFSAGTMRIDSPTLSADVVSTFALEGQLRLSFEACEIGGLTFEGSAVAYRSKDPSQYAFVPDIEYVVDGLETKTFNLDRRVLVDLVGKVSVLFELDSGATLVLEWAVLEFELSLRGLNGALVCTVGLFAGLVCTPP